MPQRVNPAGLVSPCLLLVMFGVVGPSCLGDVDLDPCAYDLPSCHEDERGPAAQLIDEYDGAESQSCGYCGTRSRLCALEENCSDWSACEDPCLVCQGVSAAPTWEDPIGTIMVDRCVRCHPESGSLGTLRRWIEDGSLEEVAVDEHFVFGNDQTALLCWLALGAPASETEL